MRVRPRITPQWELARVADAVGGRVVGAGSTEGSLAEADICVSGIALSTKDVVTGDLFAALPGSTAHGAQYAPQALAAGAVAVLTDAEGAQVLSSDVAAIVVDHPRRQLADLAADFYDRPSRALRTVGVTGTQGKTTTTYLAEAALGPRNSAVIGTVGTRIGGIGAASALTTPESPALQALFAVMREERIGTCAMEVSSHALVQGRVDGFAFDTAIFLNLGRDHLDFHRDIEDYFAAKAMLFTPNHARQAVINVDDEYGRRLSELTELPFVTFSAQGRQATWQAINLRAHRLGSDVTIVDPAGKEHELHVPLAGAFNVSNAVAVIAALGGLGDDIDELTAGIAASRGVPGRMQRVDVGQKFTAIVDYAHKPDAVEAVLGALRPITPGRLVVVIGAGGDRDRGKRPLMGRAAAERADVVIVTDDNPRSEEPSAIRAELLAGARDGQAEIFEIGDRREAIDHAVAMARAGDTVVVAGKGHERGQQVGTVVLPFDDVAVLTEVIGVHA